MNARLYDPMLHRFLQVDNYIQDPTNTQNYNQYGYVLNNPLLYTDPSGNSAKGNGQDCLDCGIYGGLIVSGLTTLGQNWDNLHIKEWANKNINGDKFSKWWKSKISFNNIFSRHKNSGPPTNMSSYININASNFYNKGINSSAITGNVNQPVRNQHMSSKEIEVISRLHKGFDTLEEIGGWMEIGGVLLAPVTEGGSLALSPVGFWHTAVGTAGNIAIDYYEGNYKMMIYRGVKFTITFGIGKAIDRIPGSDYMLDKTILKTTTFIYDKIFSASFQSNLVQVKNTKI